MKISQRYEKGTDIFYIEGSFSAMNDRNNTLLLDAASNPALGNIVLNLAETELIDSSGVGLLISIHKKVTRHGAKLAICSIPKNINELFLLTGLSNIFNTFQTEEEALASFSHPK